MERIGIHEIVVASEAGLRVRGAEVVLDLGGTDPAIVALALTLLSEGLVELLALRHPRGAWGARVRASAADRGVLLRRYHEDRLDLALGRTELELCQFFFLRYARDGAPEVDHIDVDAKWDQGGESRVTLRVSLPGSGET